MVVFEMDFYDAENNSLEIVQYQFLPSVHVRNFVEDRITSQCGREEITRIYNVDNDTEIIMNASNYNIFEI